MAVIAVFTYGSLQFAEIMRAVTGRRFRCEPATLRGYRRRLLCGRVYPGILPMPGEEVEGILYTAVDARSLALLDEFEGEPYRRRPVLVETSSGQRARAEAWVVEPARAGELSQEPWSPELFRDRHYDAFLSLCLDFGRAVRARDPGGERA